MARAPEKAGGAFRTIREVADWLGVPTHVLRFWESKFDQIAPVKGAGGRRYYRPEDMRLLGGIKVMLHDQGLTIRAVAQRIEEEGTGTVMALSPELDVPDGPPARTRRVIRQGDDAEDGAAAPRTGEPEPAPQDEPAVAAPPVPIAKDPPSPLSEMLPDQPVDPVGAPEDAPAPEPRPDLPEAPAPSPAETPLDAEAPGTPETPPPDAPADPPHQVRHAPEPEPAPGPASPVEASPVAALTRARRLAATADSVPATERKRLRRLVRRYRALAEEIADDLAEEASR